MLEKCPKIGVRSYASVNQRDNSRKRRKREKPDFSRVTDVVESCQMCWISMDMQHICNTDKKIYRTFFGKKLLENVLF